MIEIHEPKEALEFELLSGTREGDDGLHVPRECGGLMLEAKTQFPKTAPPPDQKPS